MELVRWECMDSKLNLFKSTMQYSIFIPQIHCSGCVNLIKMSLEEKFTNVSVDEVAKVAIFESKDNELETKSILDQLFEDQLSPAGYQYSNLTATNS